jgi:hypothetical protein
MPKIGVKYPNSDIDSLKRGDKVVCICEEWEYYTYGKTYTLYSDFLGCLCPVMNDKSQFSLPALYHPNGYYFVTPKIFREMKLNEILDRK